MTEEKLLQQAEIDALLKGGAREQDSGSPKQPPGETAQDAQGQQETMGQAEIDALLQGDDSMQGLDTDSNNEPPHVAQDQQDEGTMDQAEIDALLSASDAGQKPDPEAAETISGDPGDGTLGQDDIDALLGAESDDVSAKELPTDPEEVQAEIAEQQDLSAADLQSELSMAEKDALGEVGNISMGAAATTLSQLLSKRVNITSPKVQIVQHEEFITSFESPYLIIQVQFKEGFTGYNVLVIKLHDVQVMASLMMGGDGTDFSEEITEMEISAAAEAMNQMIGTSSTALADLMSKSINIAPPEVIVVRDVEQKDVRLPFTDPLVVISFDFKINDLLDTSIMQVIDIPSAREQAQSLLKSFGLLDEPGELMEETVSEPMPPEPEPVAPPVQEVIQETRTEVAAAGTLERKAPEFPVQLQDETETTQVDTQKLNLLLDIPLKVSVVLGRTRKSIKEVLSFTPGAIAELETMVEEPVDVLVNGKLVAKGEVVVVNENFGVKITSIISTTERINSLGG